MEVAWRITIYFVLKFLLLGLNLQPSVISANITHPVISSLTTQSSYTVPITTRRAAPTKKGASEQQTTVANTSQNEKDTYVSSTLTSESRNASTASETTDPQTTVVNTSQNENENDTYGNSTLTYESNNASTASETTDPQTTVAHTSQNENENDTYGNSTLTSESSNVSTASETTDPQRTVANTSQNENNTYGNSTLMSESSNASTASETTDPQTTVANEIENAQNNGTITLLDDAPLSHSTKLEIYVLRVNKTRITVEWVHPMQNINYTLTATCIKSFRGTSNSTQCQVNCTEAMKTFLVVPVPSNSSFTFTNLVPNTEYNITVSTQSNFKMGFTIIKTLPKEKPLQRIQNITGTLKLPEGVLYRWEYPDMECSSTRFDLIIGKHKEITNITNNTYLSVESNDTCQVVNITVTPVSTNGNAESFSTRLIIHDGSSGPGPIEITGHDRNATYIRINYSLPITNPTCVDSYIVKFRENLDGDLKEIQSNLSQSTELIHLQPCTNYSVQVIPRFDNHNWNYNLSRPIVIRTDFAIPGKPENLTVDPTEHTATVKWHSPIIAPKCVVGYNVTFIDIIDINSPKIEHTDFVEDATFYSTDNVLFSCTSYQVRVASFKNVVHGVQFNTTVEVPSPPTNHTIFNIESTSIMVQWDLPDTKATKYGCGFKNLTMFCESGNKNLTSTVAVLQTAKQNVNITIENMRINSPYTCYAVLINKDGLQSQESESFYIHTKEEVPDGPTNLRIENFTTSSMTVKWDPPTENKANITGYKIQVICNKTDDSRNQQCQNNTQCPESMRVFHVSEGNLHTFVGSSNTMYEIIVQANSSVGLGKESYLKRKTLPAAAGPVRNLQMKPNNPKMNDTTWSINVSWGNTCLTSGTFGHYEIHLHGKRNNFPDENITLSETSEHININNLKAEYNFIVTVQINYTDVATLGAKTTQSYHLPALIPGSKENDENKLKTLSSQVTNPSTQVNVYINKTLISESEGSITNIFLIVSTKHLIRNSSFGKPPKLPTWSETNAGIKNMYQANSGNWSSLQANKGSMSAEYMYTLGNQMDCDLQKPNVYCNGPLKPDTVYYVVLRVATADGYRDISSTNFKTDPAQLTLILVCSFVTLLVIIVISCTLIMMRRKNRGWPRKLMVTLFRKADAHQTYRQPKPVAIEKFSAYCEVLLHESKPSGESQLSLDFQFLATLSPPNVQANPSAYKTALLPNNSFKNRYTNILPYDETRVKISVVDDDPTSDYINASFIKGYSGQIEYIATQGPKLETCEDFWRMVFEHNVTLIIMVTNLKENGKDKCCKYYPDLRETKDFCFVSVKCVNEVNFAVYTSRTLLIQKNNLQKTIFQLHFREWPDFGCPASTDLMLSFCQTLRQQISLAEGLILVHCSAGVGRTGTLIGLDILLQHIQMHKKIDVFGTVLTLRHQRINMVQTEGQYLYIHKCMKDALDDPTLLSSEKSPTESTEPIYENILKNIHIARPKLALKEDDTSESTENPVESISSSSSSLVKQNSDCEEFPPPPDEDDCEYQNYPLPGPPHNENNKYKSYLPPPDEEDIYENYSIPPPTNNKVENIFPSQLTDEDLGSYENISIPLLNIGERDQSLPPPPPPEEESEYENYPKPLENVDSNCYIDSKEFSNSAHANTCTNLKINKKGNKESVM